MFVRISNIKLRPAYKDHIQTKVVIPKPNVHVTIGFAVTYTLYDAYAIFIYNITVLLGRRGDEARKIKMIKPFASKETQCWEGIIVYGFRSIYKITCKG